MKKYKSLKKECLQANQQLPVLGLVLFTFGNVSVADHTNKVFAIKPSGVPYHALTPESIVIVDFEGHRVDGHLNPSSDTKTHAFLYKTWNQLGSIVHTHSTYATAWAQAQRDIPIYGTTHADHLTDAVPCAPPMCDEMIQGDYETETGKQIVHHFIEKKLDYREVEMILIGNHAPFTWGKNSQKAIYNAAVLEEIAQMAWLTEQINPSAPYLKDALIKKHFERKHGPDSYYGQK
jgi:L-ribulose-5-phosphate 4-epimerase